MESKNQNKQHELIDTFTLNALIFILALLVAFGVGYFTTFTDVNVPYKPTKPLSNDPVFQALNISISRLENISSLPQTLISESKDPHTRENLRSCKQLLRFVAKNLNKSINLLIEGPGGDYQVVTETLNRWIILVLIQQDMCLVPLQQGSQLVVDEILKLKRLEECVTKNQAVLEKVLPLLQKKRLRACLCDDICVTI